MQTTLKMEGQIATWSNLCPPPPLLRNITILIVDDDRTTLSIIAAIVKSCHYGVLTAKDGQEAVEVLKNNSINLILSDIHMPKMDGFELLKVATEEFNKTPVILMSADNHERTVMRTLKEGAALFLKKPISFGNARNMWQYARKRTNNDNEKKKESQASLKLVEDKKDGENESNESSEAKRERIVWNGELQRKFLRAIDWLGIEGAVPKKIEEYMNVPGLTRKNIASHLQKHRINLKKNASGEKEVRGRINWEEKYLHYANQHRISKQNNAAVTTSKIGGGVTSLTTPHDNQLNLGVPNSISGGNLPFSFSHANKTTTASSSSATVPSVFEFQEEANQQPLFPVSSPLNLLPNNGMNYFAGESSGFKAVINNPGHEYQFGNGTNNNFPMEMNFGSGGENSRQTALSDYGQQHLVLDPTTVFQNSNGPERLLQGPDPIFDGTMSCDFFNGEWNNLCGELNSETNQLMVQNGDSFQQPHPLQLPSTQSSSAVQWNDVTFPQQHHLDLPPLSSRADSSSPNDILSSTGTCSLDVASGFESLLLEDDLDDTFWSQVDFSCDENQSVPPSLPQPGVTLTGESPYIYRGSDLENGEYPMLIEPNNPSEQNLFGTNNNEVLDFDFTSPGSYNVEEIPQQIPDQMDLHQFLEDGLVDQGSSPNDLDVFLALFSENAVQDISEGLAGPNWDIDVHENIN